MKVRKAKVFFKKNTDWLFVFIVVGGAGSADAHGGFLIWLFFSFTVKSKGRQEGQEREGFSCIKGYLSE